MNKLSQRLDIRQSQNLVMTPQLQQAIKLLQMNNLELTEFVEEELAVNPLLEKEERAADEGTDSRETESSDEGAHDEVRQEFDDAWTGNENVQDFDAGAVQYGKGGSSSFEDSEGSFENTLTREKTLREHLLQQLHMQFEDGRDQLIGALLIDQLDETGYLRADCDELAQRLGCSRDRIKKLMTAMKQFEPSGVFASSLEECLTIQLKDQGRLDAQMQALLENLDLLADHDMKALAEICGVNDLYLADMIEEVRALNPRPARDYEHFVVQTVIPDVLMRSLPKNLGGGWRVELNNETLPRVLVNRSYYTEVCNTAREKKDKQYLDQQMNSASWLVKALDQRAQTILKVAEQIVEEQNGFFLFGIEYLKPMTLRDIAEKIEMHESTVSRVTNNKYIGTPRGIFELKYFFSSSLGGKDGAISHSSEAVKARIKTLIDAEDPKKILSDEKIVELLKKEGIDVARRTVVKYRDAMKIPSSVQRRKQKRQ